MVKQIRVIFTGRSKAALWKLPISIKHQVAGYNQVKEAGNISTDC